MSAIVAIRIFDACAHHCEGSDDPLTAIAAAKASADT